MRYVIEKKWMGGRVRGGQWAAAGGLRVICDEDEIQNCHCVCVSGCVVQGAVHTTSGPLPELESM